MTNIKWEVGKEYRTRDGHEVRIYATDAGGDMPIHGALRDAEGENWLSMAWDAEGRDLDEDYGDWDLMPPVREWWVVKYPSGIINLYAGKEGAARVAAGRPGSEVIHVREVLD